MTTTEKEQVLALLEDLPPRGLEEALKELRSIHKWWASYDPTSVGPTRTEWKVKGSLRHAEVRPPIVLDSH